MIRVLVAEDHRAAYEAVRVACRSTQDIQVVGYCSTAKQVIPKALETRPDVVLLSLVMLRKPGDQTPALCGLEVAEELLADLPGTPGGRQSQECGLDVRRWQSAARVRAQSLLS